MGKSTAPRARVQSRPTLRRKRRAETTSEGVGGGDDSDRETIAPESTAGPSSASRQSEHTEQSEASDESAPRAATAPMEARQYRRVQLQRVSARQKRRAKHVDGWEVLVPTKGALSMLAAALPGTQRTSCKLCPLGAVYPSADGAAKAADRALIALSGRLAAESLLNWPLDAYPEEECHQLYGPHLARYLNEIVQESKEEMEMARSRLGPPTVRQEDRARKRARKVRDLAVSKLIQEEPLYTFAQQPCGLCRPCRHPELGKRCLRAQMGTPGYQPRNHAILEVEGVEKRAYHVAMEKAREEGDLELYRRLQQGLAGISQEEARTGRENLPIRRDHSDDGLRHSRTTGEAMASVQDGCRSATSLQWLMDPSDVSAPLSTAFAKERQRRAMALAEQISVEVGRSKRSIIESTKKRSWEMPTGALPSGNKHDDILVSRRLAENESAELIESHADDPNPGFNVERKCRWCGAKQHGSRSQKQCPFLQAALAISLPVDFDCAACKDAPGASCSACLRGSAGLPPEVVSLDVPLRQDAGRVDWATRLSPGMLDLVWSIRRIAGAAVSEFGAEHLTAKLSPDALLAIAAIAETLIDDALKQAR